MSKPRKKYAVWLEAEHRAQQAEQAARLQSRARGEWSRAAPDAESQARELRARADSLFEDAMNEMAKDVEAALHKPLRKHYP